MISRMDDIMNTTDFTVADLRLLWQLVADRSGHDNSGNQDLSDFTTWHMVVIQVEF